MSYNSRIMGIKVVYDQKKKEYIKGEAQWIESNKILNTRVERIKGDDKIIITTTEGLFFYNTLVDNFTNLMSELENFEYADRGVVVNLAHDLTLDIDKRMIIFEGYPEVTSTVGISRMSSIKKLIKKWVLGK
ncbi:hypothetical protein [Paenibacillus tianjinensis]|uniref:LytTr DNA-binding domain-containing protein n=1 Tax=Paenibacillus tianjinensis TaxID=2810347 RepID=A0ABX7L9Q9_9BACL|nr:hypothetical protein [Paenibacillus tianjinensis]QSF43468.1 hypothetical protein JRJ22_19585 [Paenibacillus tianjinensis]